MKSNKRISVKKGKSAEILVKKHLWTFGFSVKDYSEICGLNSFDLLVNKKYKIEVKTGKLNFNNTKSNYNYWAFSGIKVKKFDILAIIAEPIDKPYYINVNDLIKYFYYTKDKYKKINKNDIYEINIKVKKSDLDKYFVRNLKKII